MAYCCNKNLGPGVTNCGPAATNNGAWRNETRVLEIIVEGDIKASEKLYSVETYKHEKCISAVTDTLMNYKQFLY